MVKVATRVLVIASVALLPTVAFAQAPACGSGETEIANTTTLLTGQYVCAKRLPDTWQELHQAGGALYDWKLGPSSAMDPVKLVGSWSGSTTGVVTHAYNAGGGSYVWRVCSNGAGTYTFRSATGGVISNITLIAGTATQSTQPCPP